MDGGITPTIDDFENTMRILLTTDTHLGFKERDGVRGEDSLHTFEEILQLAVDHDVDFIIHGGDLFHDNNPSRRTLYECMRLLRKYCIGDKPCSIQYLGEEAVDFGHTAFPRINYHDPDMNVAIPFFAVHGRHDDPAGRGNLCPLDLLSVNGLVNFFGRYLSMEKVDIRPLLLKKGSTRLALYGLGSVHDERLNRMYASKDISMLRPMENQEDWFNMFVIHQNRYKHGNSNNYIPENVLDDFLDLVFWGHEHECLIEPVKNETRNFEVTQPGSSIATTLKQEESRPKHVGLLLIKDKQFEMRKITLQTVRPFVFKDLKLSDTGLDPQDPMCKAKCEDYCKHVVNDMIQKAEEKMTGHRAQPREPLIRLRIDHEGGFETFSVVRFGQKFVNRVANPRDVIQFLDKAARKRRGTAGSQPGKAEVKDQSLDIAGMATQYFAALDQRQQMKLLSLRGLEEAVRRYVEKEENDAIEEEVQRQLTNVQNYLLQKGVKDEESIEEELMKMKKGVINGEGSCA